MTNKLDIILGKGATKKGVEKRLHFTKQEISAFLNVDNRTARDYISQYAQEFPVISLSRKFGYLFIPEPEKYIENEKDSVASNKDLLSLDTKFVEEQIAEIESRVKVLKQRQKALKKWLAKTKQF